MGIHHEYQWVEGAGFSDESQQLFPPSLSCFAPFSRDFLLEEFARRKRKEKEKEREMDMEDFFGEENPSSYLCFRLFTFSFRYPLCSLLHPCSNCFSCRSFEEGKKRKKTEDERKSGKGGRREGEEDVGGGGLGFGKWVEGGGFMIQD